MLLLNLPADLGFHVLEKPHPYAPLPPWEFSSPQFLWTRIAIKNRIAEGPPEARTSQLSTPYHHPNTPLRGQQRATLRSCHYRASGFGFRVPGLPTLVCPTSRQARGPRPVRSSASARARGTAATSAPI